MRADEKELQKARKEFVELLFEKKGQWGRDINKGGDRCENAYQDIHDEIQKKRVEIVRRTQTKLIRERAQFNPNSNQYKKRIEMSRNVDRDTLDNLIKMVIPIVLEVELKKLQEMFVGHDFQDEEAGTIEQRVTRNRAE